MEEDWICKIEEVVSKLIDWIMKKRNAVKEIKMDWAISYFGFVSWREYYKPAWFFTFEVGGPVASFRILGLTLNLYKRSSIIERANGEKTRNK